MKNRNPEPNIEDLNQKILVQDEIMALAKANSPRLLNKFRLVYPDFLKSYQLYSLR
ncbi:hypothetical protein OWR28_11955 [Chryseobacterium sp. 1B4]